MDKMIEQELRDRITAMTRIVTGLLVAKKEAEIAITKRMVEKLKERFPVISPVVFDKIAREVLEEFEENEHLDEDFGVVRCKDCKHRYTTECALFYGANGNTEYFGGACYDDCFYCEYAERKE